MKIEAKGSLWKVHCSDGQYSDRGEETYVVSANSIEEAKLVFKMALKEKVVVYGYNKLGAIFENNEQYQFEDITAHDWKDKDDEVNWDTGYGDAFDVSITRLEVIYA